MYKKISIIMIAMLSLAGCAAMHPQSDESLSSSGGQKQQEAKMPDPDAAVTVRQFVEAHDQVMGGIGDIKASNQKMQGDLSEIKATNQKALETAQKSLQIIEDMAAKQGTGEITVFFPTGSSSLHKGSLEYDRLVRFADFLSRESKGRKIIFLSIGSASATGHHETNMKLAKKRSEAPVDVLDKYLINIPHEYYKVYGTGDLHSPKKATMKENQRFQHTRIIALFDTAQAPKVNEEPAK
jgi:outer membrane protein OmpA-like peptidoglycan-associated protein